LGEKSYRAAEEPRSSWRDPGKDGGLTLENERWTGGRREEHLKDGLGEGDRVSPV